MNHLIKIIVLAIFCSQKCLANYNINNNMRVEKLLTKILDLDKDKNGKVEFFFESEVALKKWKIFRLVLKQKKITKIRSVRIVTHKIGESLPYLCTTFEIKVDTQLFYMSTPSIKELDGRLVFGSGIWRLKKVQTSAQINK